MSKAMMIVLAGMFLATFSQAESLFCDVNGVSSSKTELRRNGKAEIRENLQVGNTLYRLSAGALKGKMTLVTIENSNTGAMARAFGMFETETLVAGLKEAGASEVIANCAISKY